MECHPEEDNHSEYQAQSNNTLSRLFLCQLRLCTCSLSFVCLTLSTFNMTECPTEDVIDSYREDQRCTSDSKCEMVTVINACSEILLRPLHNTNGCCRSEKSTDIDSHVEQRESGIALVRILWIIVKIAYHHLEVTLKQTCSKPNQYKCCQHHYKCKCVATKRY